MECYDAHGVVHLDMINDILFSKLSRRILLLSAIPALGVIVIGSADAQEYRFNSEHRRPVMTTLRHLEEMSHIWSDHKQHERYDHAVRHLKEFAERLHEGGGFDESRLSEAIGDVQNVIDHNRMSDHDRDVLARDVGELRRLREHYREREYRYELR